MAVKKKPEPVQVMAVRFPDGEELQIRDLPVDVLTRIARRNTTSWATVIDSPGVDLSIARDVLEEAARLLGIDMPDLVTGRELLAFADKAFVLVDDDLPEMPEAEGGGENPTDAS